jgi:hypothetical protein
VITWKSADLPLNGPKYNCALLHTIENNGEYGMKTLHKIMRKGALVISNNPEVESLPDPSTSSSHELFSHEQCALALQKDSKSAPCFLNCF